MASCNIVNTCGTGTGSFVHPDDPDLNNSVLRAKPAFGGIDVTWTYPEHNAHAVAHTILYRSANADPGTKVRLGFINSSSYRDVIENGPRSYYYWIEIVSINGTVGDLIGPAFATSRNTVEETIKQLTGKIDASLLASSLKTIIGGIGENATAIETEKNSRINGDGSLSLAFSDLEINLGDVRTALIDTQEELRSADQALVNTVEGVYAQTEENQSLILEEQTVRATEMETLSQNLTTVESNLGSNIAQVQTNLQTNIQRVQGDVDHISTRYTTVLNVDGLIGGFGIGNDGEMVDAGFDVDRFWVGRTNENKRKPFIIDTNGEVFINEGVINRLVVDKLETADGELTFRNGRLRAGFIEAENLRLDYGNIKNVDIDTADIKNGAITNAKLENASVDSLKIGRNEVTLASSSSISGYGGNYLTHTLSGLPRHTTIMFHVNWLVNADYGNPETHTFRANIYRNGVLKQRRYFYMYSYGSFNSISMPVVTVWDFDPNKNNVKCEVELFKGNGTSSYVPGGFIDIIAFGAKR